MRRWFGLVLWVLVSAAPAHAIVITEGSFSATVLNDFSPFFNMHGEGFSVTGIDNTGGNPLPFQMVRTQNVNRRWKSAALLKSALG